MSVLEERLRQLAQRMDSRSTLTSRVMREVNHQSKAASPTVPRRSTNWITQPAVRYVSVLAAVTMLVVVVARLNPGGASAGLAFAEVQQALRQVKMVAVDVSYPMAAHRNMRMVIGRDSGRLRLEWPTGLAYIIDAAEEKALLLDRNEKTAHLLPYAEDFDVGNLLEQLVNVEQKAVRHMGKRTLDGRTLVEFLLEREERLEGRMEVRVWVDFETRLPVRMEEIPVDPDNSRTAHLHAIHRFTFNEPPDNSLLSLTPPRGFKVETGPMRPGEPRMPLPPATEDTDFAAPVIEQGLGIGRARFGMSVEQVINVLGQPDEMLECRLLSSDAQQALAKVHERFREAGLDDIERRRLLREAEERFRVKLDWDPQQAGGRLAVSGGDLDGVSLDYAARGFRLTILDDQGLLSIDCVTGESGVRDFSGRTSQGIAMGATFEEIKRAYGPPDAKDEHPDDSVHLKYESLGMWFWVQHGRLRKFSVYASDED